MSTPGQSPPVVQSALARLAIASATALFLELACIRWVGSHVVYLSYVSNLVLIAAFFGLGLGALLAGSSARKTIERWICSAPWWLLVLLGVVLGAELEVQVDGSQAVYFGNPHSGAALPAWLVLPALGGLITCLFVSLGFAVGRELSAARPLVAYSVDIAGSLAGIALFGVVSFAGVPAHVWFVAATLALLAIMPANRGAVASTAVATIAIAAAVVWGDDGSRWSPYQRVTVLPLGAAPARAPNDPAAGSPAYRLRVNSVVHQYITDVRLREPFYEFPYRAAGATLPGARSNLYLTAKPPNADWTTDPFTPRSGWGGRVAVIGAGNGTDTAVALAYGASHVDAVEIDPLLAEIGRELQPNRPYRDPRVRVHVMDGRTFLERSTERYDVVVFGLPDSVTLASPYAGLRLESFLFTEQSFRSALERLHPERGLLVVYNYYRTPWLVDRIANTLQQAAGDKPRVWVGPDKNLAAVFIAGPGAARVDPELPRDWGFRRREELAGVAASDLGASQDDWPFLYLRERAIPGHILLSLLIILGLGAAVIGLALRRPTPAAAARGERPSWRELAPFFFMGAAFLLLETSGLVRMSLLFGATWLVNALVFAAVLSMVLVANLLAARVPAQLDRYLSVLLVASLALAWLVPPASVAGWSAVPKYAVTTALLFVPVLLGNVRFSLAFRDTAYPAQAFGANLLGAVVGGALENLALLWGYRALFLVAAGLYLAAFGVVAIRVKSPKTGYLGSVP